MILVNNGITLQLVNKNVHLKFPSFVPIAKKEIPFIAPYYFNAKPFNDEDIIIPLYITNEKQSEYRLDQTNYFFRFVVGINDVETTFSGVQIGDYELNIGKKSPGQYHITLKVVDQYGNESHELYYKVWVVDRTTYPITTSQTYTVTDSDLTTYGINKNDSQVVADMVNNRVGLTNLFKDKQTQGYRKIILPLGCYRVNRTPRTGTGTTTPIDIPSGLTVDLNSSTIKLHPYLDTEYGSTGGVDNLMIRMQECIDSHVINGVLEGDYAERKVLGGATELDGEGCNCHQFVGGAYNSLKNVTITQITGYSMITKMENRLPIKSCGTFESNKSVDENGQVVAYDGHSVSPFIDISVYVPNQVLAVSKYLGYGGLVGDWYCKLHFYDSNLNFLVSKTYMQYRTQKIPTGAIHMRVEMFSVDTDIDTIRIYEHATPRYCSIEDSFAIDNRTCFAPSQFQHLLYRNIKFTRSGQSITPAAIDLEDGWEQMQDFFLYDCEILEQTGTRDYIVNAGINNVLKGNKNFRVDARDGLTSFCMQDNTDSTLYLYTNAKNKKRHRIKNNSFGNLTLSANANADLFRVRDNTISFTYADFGDVEKFELYKNIIEIKGTYKNFHAVDCDVKILSNTAYVGESVKFTKCRFNEDITFPTTKFSFNALNVSRLFDDCVFNSDVSFVSHNNFNSGVWKRCVFKKNVTIDPKQDNTQGTILFENCVFESDVTINTTTTNYIVFKNCTFLANKILNTAAQTNAIFV